MTIRSGTESAQWTAAQARGSLDGTNYVLTVLLGPADVRGTALLIKEEPGKPTLEWVYLPALRRVRQILPVNEFDAFLNTEFTYADFGFVNVGDRELKTLGSVDVERRRRRAGAGDADRPAHLHAHRHVAGARHRPTAEARVLRPRQPSLEGGDVRERRRRCTACRPCSACAWRTSRPATAASTAPREIAYGVTIPKELFDPGQLPRAADSPLWK